MSIRPNAQGGRPLRRVLKSALLFLPLADRKSVV